MAVDGTGTRATGRILDISKDTVTAILKKTKDWSWQVNYNYIRTLKTQGIEVKIVPSNQVIVAEAEFDEMWSFVSDKSHQC